MRSLPILPHFPNGSTYVIDFMYGQELDGRVSHVCTLLATHTFKVHVYHHQDKDLPFPYYYFFSDIESYIVT